jgi:hypothetical protein
MLPTISDTALNSLNDAAVAIQRELASRGEQYAIADLNEVLSLWLELSVEQLCEDALFHCITGDRSFSFNRLGFEAFLKKVEPQTEAAPALEQAA